VLSGNIAFNFVNPYMLASCTAATLFIVMNNGTGIHPFSTRQDGVEDGWINFSGSIYEPFGLASRQQIGFNTSGRRMIYNITCNPVTQKTTIFNGTSQIYQNTFSNINWRIDPTCKASIGNYGSYYTFSGNLMEIILYNFCLTESTSPTLSSVINSLKSKWVIA
jgi:hypothetical protein